jgi:hypothetical protein
MHPPVYIRKESGLHEKVEFTDLTSWHSLSIEEVRRRADELKDLINTAQDERPVQAYLEQNLGLLIQLVSCGPRAYVLPQPRLGSEYIPDFAVGCLSSGGIYWTLIELENPNFEVLTRQGQPTAKLTHAIQQINDWRIWLRDNSQYAQNELGYRDLNAEFNATIVIGRRKEQTRRGQQRYRELSQGRRLEIMSYDRLLEQVTKSSALFVRW